MVCMFCTVIMGMIKAASRGDSNYINLQIKGAALGYSCGDVTYDDYVLIRNLGNRLLEDM